MKSIIAHTQDWSDWMKVRNYSPSTIQTRNCYIKPFVAYLSGEGVSKVEDVDRECLRRYWRMLQTSPKSYSIHAMGSFCLAVKSLFMYLTEAGVICDNPAVVLSIPSTRGLLPKQAPPYEQVIKMLEAPDINTPIGLRDKAQMELLYSSGLRVEECQNLTVFDIDIQGGVIRVIEGKGRKDREVPLGIEASRYLRMYLEKVRPRYAARAAEPTDRLWLGRKGNPQGKLNMEWSMRKYRTKTGCDHRMTPHGLRRAMATGMLSNGADIHTIGQILGHVRLETTTKYAQSIALEVRETHDQTHPRERSTEAATKAEPMITRIKPYHARRYPTKP